MQPDTRITIERSVTAPQMTVDATELFGLIDVHFREIGRLPASMLSIVVQSEYGRILSGLARNGKTTGLGDRVISV